MDLYYRIILGNDIMEPYHRIILMNRIPGIPGESPDAPGTSRISRARPWDPPGMPLGPPGTPLGPPGTPLGSLWTPGDPHGPKKQQYLNKCTAPEALDCCIRILSLQHISQ